MSKKPFRHEEPHKAGDASRKTEADGGKICSGCNKFKTIENFFPIRRKGKSFVDYSAKCKPCMKTIHYKWAASNKVKYHRYIKNWAMKSGYRKRRDDERAYVPVIQLINLTGFKLTEMTDKRIKMIAEEANWTMTKVRRAIQWALEGKYEAYLDRKIKATY